MEDKYEKEIMVLPDFLEGCSDEAIHTWRRWVLITKKIDNDPDRWYTVVDSKTGKVKEYDMKANVGVIIKSALQLGITKEEADRVREVGNRIQRLQVEKGILKKKWNKLVFNTKKGDDGILALRSAEILTLFGKFYTVKEIHTIIKEKWGTGISEESIQKFGVHNKTKIDKAKADYILNSKELRLATDAGRLELLSMLAFEMEKKFEKGQSIEVSKELRGIVEQIRREVKGDEIKLTIDGRIDIQATIQANMTLNEVLQKLPVNMIILGLVAAKQKINPAVLIASLGNSYYSKVNGFGKLYDKSEVELPGKFIRQYDWDQLKRNHDELEQSKVIEDITVFEEVTETVRPLVETKREELKKLLDSYNKMVND